MACRGHWRTTPAQVKTEKTARHMTGWELRIWRKSMLWSREKAAREFGVTQRTWHAWENAEQVDVTVWRTTQALSVRDLLPHMQGMRKADIIRRLENELGETAEDV